MQKKWLDVFNEIGREAPQTRREPPETAQTGRAIISPPPPENVSQGRIGALEASTRAALIDAIDAGKTARALDIALQALADLTGDRGPLERNNQDRAAMGEEWRRAYKVWSAHIPRIREAQTIDEVFEALDKAYDACKAISDGTGQDGLSVGLGLMGIFERGFNARYNVLRASLGDSERMPWEIDE